MEFSYIFVLSTLISNSSQPISTYQHNYKSIDISHIVECKYRCSFIGSYPSRRNTSIVNAYLCSHEPPQEVWGFIQSIYLTTKIYHYYIDQMKVDRQPQNDITRLNIENTNQLFLYQYYVYQMSINNIFSS